MMYGLNSHTKHGGNKMATRKKKTEISEINDLPTVVVGSHLTVITYKDGRTELKWDDEALLRDVKQAILKFESNIPAAVKTVRKKKTKATTQ